jgi:hypothetical protein
MLITSIPKGAETGKISVFGLGGRTESTEDFVVEKLSLQESVTIYPNPSKGVFIVDFSKANFYSQSIKIYNSIGKQVYENRIANYHSDKLIIEFSSALKGIYVIVIQTHEGPIMRKIALK